MEIAGEVEVHLLHWHDLGITAARSATLHAEVWPKRCLADTDGRVLADPIQAITQAYGRRCLPLACGRRVDRRDQDQLAIFAVFNRIDKALADLCFVVAVGQQIIARDAQLGTNFLNGQFVRFACDLNIGLIGHGRFPFLGLASVKGALAASLRSAYASFGRDAARISDISAVSSGGGTKVGFFSETQRSDKPHPCGSLQRGLTSARRL